MSDAAAPTKKVVKATKPKVVPAHPPVATMVNDAIAALKERKGSSLIAIKKYMAANNKVDVAKLAPFIKRYLKSAVESGKLVQTKGTGAAGSFKIAKVEKPTVAKKPAAKKPAAKKVAKKVKTPKKAAAKKVKTPKKAAKSPKKAAKKPAAKKPAAAKKAKTPKKAVKPKTAKPKAAKKPAAKK